MPGDPAGQPAAARQQVWEVAQGLQGGTKNFPEFFGDLAEKYSIEASTRSLRGQVPPIQRFGGQPDLEKEAFAMKPGELSGVIGLAGEKFVILYCEGYTVPAKMEFAQVRDLILQDVQEKKLRLSMAEYFQRLQDGATIENYLAGTTQSPKIAAPPKATAEPSTATKPGASSTR